ncbi:ankyrin repeat domain-containing protein [Legionella cardiaca]|uniref:Ankyrin repeat domain-containing protein n=1 Tax=Legionella cardiaca TaxID=1071983 RepID=A0ABY8AQW7_9GAMM|nr:ankyrin repeat domain-containing protein [Legionella cardiaca]WED42166.1 ankyrin repeat domain-containing protein [Legionella cardiaca]
MLTEERLRLAIAEGNVEQFKYTIQHADLETLTAIDKEGRTLGHYIARFNQPAMMEILIQTLESIDRTSLSTLEYGDSNDFTVLEYCYLYSAPKIVGLLAMAKPLDRSEQCILDKNSERLKSAILRMRLNAKIKNALFAAAAGEFSAFELIIKEHEKEFSLYRTKEGWSFLHFAAFNNNINFCISFLEKNAVKASIEAKDNNGNTPFLVAIERNSPKHLEYFLEIGCDIHCRNYHGENAVSIAAKFGQLITVKYLQEKGVDLFAVNDQGESALMLAAKRGYFHVVSFLKDTGVPANTKNKKGDSAFTAALESGFIDIAKLLIDVSTVEELNAALFAAILRGDLSTTIWLVTNGASLTTKNAEGNTPFLEACMYGHLPIIKLFLSLDIPFTKDENDNGENGLYLAIRNRQKEIVQYFIEDRVFSFPQNNKQGQSPLLAAAASNAADLVECFHAAGYRLDEQDNEGNTALHLAFASEKYGVVAEYFFSNCPLIVKKTNAERKTPLHMAIKYKKNHYLPLLVKFHSDLEACDAEGNTPLLLATRTRNFEAMTFLLKAGVNIHAKNNNEDTVATITTLSCFPDTLREQILQAHQIDPHEFLYRRRLYFIFGGEKLNEVLAFPQAKIKLGSGGVEEGMSILHSYLKDFLAEKRPDLFGQFQPLLKVMENFKSYYTPAHILSSLKFNGLVFQSTGFQGHAILATLKNLEDGSVKLSLAERGARVGNAPFHHSKNKRFASLRTIIIPKGKLEEIVNLLFTAKDESLGVAMDILFKKIPMILEQPYKFLNIYQKKFVDICFYSNPKTGLYEQFIDILGTESKLFYKQFERYVREKELQKYEIFWQKNLKDGDVVSNPIIVEARHLIAKREEEIKIMQHS